MRLILAVLICCFTACSKIDKSTLEQPEFKDLVGTWTTNYSSDEERKVVVEKNGKVKIFKSTERGKNFKITSFEIHNTTLNGESINELLLYRIIDGKVKGTISFFKNLNSDSTFINLHGYINGFETDTNFSVVNKIYTRQ